MTISHRQIFQFHVGRIALNHHERCSIAKNKIRFLIAYTYVHLCFQRYIHSPDPVTGLVWDERGRKKPESGDHKIHCYIQEMN